MSTVPRVGSSGRWLLAAGLGAVLLLSVLRQSTADSGHPLAPYIEHDKYLGGPASRLSFSVQPWRGYLETVPASTFLNGIGINWQEIDPRQDAAVARRLSAAGFRSARLEIGFGSLNTMGTAFRAETGKVYLAALRAMKVAGIKPLILLNANSGEPAPHSTRTVTATREASRGSRQLHLSSTSGMSAEHSGLTTDFMACDLFRAIRGNIVVLYKPLAARVRRGARVRVDTLSFEPFDTPGTPAFGDTITAWQRYVGLTLGLTRAAGFVNSDIQVELWNELTFGSEFLDKRAYTEPKWRSLDGADFAPGSGRIWRLLAETTSFVRRHSPGVRVINGFTNTDFLRFNIPDLPPVAGQSYHPYGTGLYVVGKNYPFPSDRSHLTYLPNGLRLALPEGVYSTDTAIEQLPRNLVQPELRQKLKPRGMNSFAHYETEDGWSPREQGVTARGAAAAVRTKAMLRGLTFWLNKGLAGLWVFEAHDPDPAGFGILDPANPGGVTTPELTALHNLVAIFSGSTPISNPRQLSVDVTATGRQVQAFPGGHGYSTQWYRDLFTLLPYQASAHRFVIPIYTMSYDITRPLPELFYTIDLHGVDGTRAKVQYFDPVSNSVKPVKLESRSHSDLRVTLSTMDYPRVLVISD